jgi:hypothetical protein
VPRPRDLHTRIRSAVKATVDAAALAGDVGLTDSAGKPMRTYEQTDLHLDKVDFPCVVCYIAATERNRGGSNGRDDLAFPVAVGLFVAGPDTAPEAKPNLTNFRLAVSGLFNQKRLSGVSEVMWCEADQDTPILDITSRWYDQLRTSLSVNAITRTGRG